MNLISDPTINLLLIHCSDGIAAFDQDYNYTIWNKAMESLTGIKAEEVIGKNAFELFPYLKEKGVDQHFYSTVEGKTNVIIENNFRMPSGRRNNVEVTTFPHKDKNGNIIGGIHIHKDLTRLKDVKEVVFHNIILENVSDSIIVTDLEGKVTYWNKGAEAIFQYTEDEVLGKTLEFINPGGNEALGIELEDISKGKSYEDEWKGIRKDGNIVWLLAKTSILNDEKGNAIGYIGVAKDITEKVLHEKKLKEDDIRYRELLESAPTSIIVLQEGKMVFANEATATFLNASSKDEVVGRNVLDFVHPASIDKVKERLQKVLAGEKVKATEHKIIDFSGEVKEIESIGSMIEYDGKPGIQVILYDITERNMALESLRRSEEKIKKITNELPGVVFQFIYQSNGTTIVDFINEYIYQDLDFDPEVELTVDDLYKCIYAEDLKEFKLSLYNAVKNQKEWDHEFRYENKYQEINWVRATAAVEVQEDNSLKYTGFLKDVNERKQNEQEIKRKNEKLNQLKNNLETIRDEEKRKISMEIHDGVGQELTGLKLELFWLKKKIDTLNEHKNTELISKKVDDLIGIVGNTIENTRRIAHDLRPVLLDKVGLVAALEYLVQNFATLNKVNCHSIFNIDDVLLTNEVSNTIYRIFQESLNNVSKYAKASKVMVSLISDKKNIILSIKDNGIGINMTELEQTNKLGLFNIKERVNYWNGEFNITSKPGKGTQLEIILPIINIPTNIND